MSKWVRKELPLYADHILMNTQIGNYRVSTIKRTPDLKRLDAMIVATTEVMAESLGKTREEFEAHVNRKSLKDGFDLAEPGEYESMVFNCDDEGHTDDWEELTAKRYDTEEEALKGHEELVKSYSLESSISL